MPTREERQQTTHQMTKCSCGNVARHGTDMCGRCQEEADQAAQAEKDRNHLLWTLDLCNNVEDLKSFIKEHLLS